MKTPTIAIAFGLMIGLASVACAEQPAFTYMKAGSAAAPAAQPLAPASAASARATASAPGAASPTGTAAKPTAAPAETAPGTSAAAATMNNLARSAEQELAKSIQDLNDLRDQIAGEKLPLADNLTTLESRIVRLRRDQADTTRQVDAGNLELAAIKADTKVRQDELTYVSNLLDEYARNLETKVNVSELQYCGQAIETAKQATTNNALSLSEKFTRQTDLANVSISRLFKALTGMRFPGIGVDLQSSVVEGQFACIGPVALFHAKVGGLAGLVVPQNGSPNPLIRPLQDELQAGIAALVDSGDGTLPLDPSRGAALKSLIQKTNLLHIFQKGGPVMYPLLLASILALGTVLERVIFLIGEKLRRDPKAMEAFFFAVGKGDYDGAVLAAAKSKFYVVRSLSYALQHRKESLANALLYAQAKEMKRFQRGVPVLDTIITLAPLLGLLGTVTGMMGSFSLIGGELSSPGAITGGIAEALIATAFGLGIAITSLIPFNILNSRAEQAQHEIESAGTQLELMIKPEGMAASAALAHAVHSVAPRTQTLEGHLVDYSMGVADDLANRPAASVRVASAEADEADGNGKAASERQGKE